MHRAQILLTFLLAGVSPSADFSGAGALEFTRRAVALGPRPSNSEAHRKLQDFIRSRLKLAGCEIIEDRFTARTPLGPVPMNNLIARFRGKSGHALVVSGHYETKRMPGINFVGANDGGSSTGFLLEMARALAGQPRVDDVYLVWFDGEEAIGQWSDTDGIHGSRHLAERWAADRTLYRIKALINVDMIGDKDLGILRESNSSASLRKLIWGVARELGYGAHFLSLTAPVEDDHMPFVRKGANAVNLIDFDYGPGNSFWHTPQDTMDKLSAQSFDVVGRVVLESLRRLEIGR